MLYLGKLDRNNRLEAFFIENSFTLEQLLRYIADENIFKPKTKNIKDQTKNKKRLKHQISTV